ncbi:putative amidase AmiD [Aureimonas endophytica]|uniref:Amidase AmiD n=1 Tax=Aureimonas endophytica TaxID=2027858 RepID=A0A917E4U6_9HYPH|nr:amidase [Aureimonas endophytica]GGE03742.1 putative amidase AmiD [Aureimonas endophytica]
MSDNLAFSSFTGLADALSSGAVSPVRLVETMLDRIGRHDGRLHAYAHVAAEGALAAARRAEAEIRSGGWRGPLHGVPLAVKDVFYTEDMPTRFGSPVHADFEAPHESTATARLRAAGAILLGKLTLTEGVYADHHPSVVPPVNPFGAAHWTGTSSSGSGVAVTAGLAYGTLGTDTGGSIRLPSSCCGLVGIKPTWGRVSRHGVFPLAESLDHVGPMARSVADAAALLSAIAGADPADPTSAPVPVPDYAAAAREARVAGLTIGIDWRYLRSRADDAVLASIEAVLDTLARLGATIVEVSFPDPDAILRGWAVQCAVEAALAHRATYPSRRAEYGPRLSALLDRGAAFSAADLAEALQDRREFNGRVATVFAGIDLLLVPGLPVAGPSLAHMASLGEDPEAILAIGPFTAPFDVCGYPTITLPCGASGEGIPIGCQLVARPFAEDVLCGAGAAYQRVTDWHERRPAL